MNKHHVRLFVTLVLLMATLTLGWGSAQARSVAGWSSGSDRGTSVSTRPVAIVTSGDPDVGQTIVVRHGLGRNPGGDGRASWFQRVRSIWTAWYLRAVL